METFEIAADIRNRIAGKPAVSLRNLDEPCVDPDHTPVQRAGQVSGPFFVGERGVAAATTCDESPLRFLLPVEFDAAGDAVDFAGEDVVFAERVADPIVREQDAAGVGVAVEDNAE